MLSCDAATTVTNLTSVIGPVVDGIVIEQRHWFTLDSATRGC